MKTIPAALLADLRSDVTHIAFVWCIQMSDGRTIRGTEHDLDIIIPATGSSPVDPFAGTYYSLANVTLGDVASTSDLSVDNLEVTGAFADSDTSTSPHSMSVLDITVSDIENGLLNRAPVTIILLNWQYPEHGYFIAKAGTLGAINTDSDGKYTTEVRGLTQSLAQTVIRTFATACNVIKFGDGRCRFNVGALQVTGHVTLSSSNEVNQFEVVLGTSSPAPSFTPSYAGGEFTFTSGANAGFIREAKLDPNQNGGIIQFWDAFPFAPSEGDTFTLTPGCDRTRETCRDHYQNLVHFRGYGLFIPGLLRILEGPDGQEGLSSS